MSNVQVCETIQEVNEHIKRFELSTCSKYIVNKIDKGYSIHRDLWKPPLTRMRVFWEWTKRKDLLIPFDGMPFMFVGCKILGCHRGKDKHARRKQQYAEQREREDQEGSEGKKGRRHHLIKTKKLSCPAIIGVTRIAKFPEYKLQNADRERERKTVSSMLRDALETDPGSVQRKDLYVIKLPNVSDHSSHPVPEGEEEVDERVQALIKEKVKVGVTKVADIKEHMVHFVHTELFPDSAPPEVRAFFPKEKTIRSIMKQARNEIHFTKIDLANLLTLAETWKQQAPRTNFLLRIQSESENLLLCYQTDWQQDLLHLYGKEVCFLDAAYRRSHFPLPLYFLCVRTSFSLAAVGLFVLQTKSYEALVEALEIFRQWNPAWKPNYILTEDCPQEMVAVETVFSGCQSVFNDYLREKTWTQWLCNGNRTITNHTEVLKMMCTIAGALTKEEHQVAVQQLQESSIWTRPLFKDWFTNKWLSEEKRWANAVRADVVNFVSQMNQGVALQRQFFTHKSLREHKDKNLSAMLQFLVDHYLPQMLGRYNNLKQESAEFVLHPTMPFFLWRRPKAVVTCVMDNLHTATQNSANVGELSEGTFRVQVIIEEGQAYTVSFGTKSRMPFCECEVWRTQRLPCQHFCHIFSSVSGWGWERLCPRYRKHLLLSADPSTETEDAITEITEPVSSECPSDWVGSPNTVAMTPQGHLITQAPPPVAQALSNPAVPVSAHTQPSFRVFPTPQDQPNTQDQSETLSPSHPLVSKSALYIPAAPVAPRALTATVIPIQLHSQTPAGSKTILVPIVPRTWKTPPPPAPQGKTVSQWQITQGARKWPVSSQDTTPGPAQFILLTQAPPEPRDTSKQIIQPLTTQAQTAVQLLCLKDELQRKCVDALKAVTEDVAQIKDIKHLQELRQRLDALQTHTRSMLPQNPCPQPAAPSTPPAKKRKQAGVDIIVTMPKYTKAPAKLPTQAKPPQT